MTPDIKRILVPLDFSASSQLALDYAHVLARRFAASLHLVHVCEVPGVASGSLDAYAIAYGEWTLRLGEEAEKELARVAGRMTDVPVTTEVIFGSPARSIVGAAHACRSDLVVMGTHGRGAVMHIVMGNVAERVVRTAPCPVLTVRQRYEVTRADPTTHETVKAGAAKVIAVGVFALSMLLPGLAAAQDAAALTQSVPGSELFRTYCAVCHGSAARGDGPLASSMTRKPANLTEIAARNGGAFPGELVFRTIDGRNRVKGHGGPDMPVWGDAFARSRDGGGADQVRKMIQSLVDFLDSVQARPAQ
jgi:nucleotide-binding universal stress UspA family protein/mono/diheme cytochrome c family protein